MWNQLELDADGGGAHASAPAANATIAQTTLICTSATHSIQHFIFQHFRNAIYMQIMLVLFGAS